MTDMREASSAVVAANDALKELGVAVRQLADIRKDQDERIQAIKDENKPLIEELEAKIAVFKTILVNLWEEHGSELRDAGSKSATLRNGRLYERATPASLWVGDWGLVMKYFRIMGVVKKYTHLPPREIDKTALKRDRAFVDQAPDDLLRLERGSNLYATPTQSLVESQRGTAALQIPLTGKHD